MQMFIINNLTSNSKPWYYNKNLYIDRGAIFMSSKYEAAASRRGFVKGKIAEGDTVRRVSAWLLCE